MRFCQPYPVGSGSWIEDCGGGGSNWRGGGGGGQPREAVQCRNARREIAEGEQSSQDWDGAAWCCREEPCAAGWEN